jgi:hypothetical protein
MPKSYRIRTQPGVDKSIQVQVQQDFDFLEILSLKLRQEDVYTRFCADYGVVVGRVFANGGTGIPNARVSIFIPLDELDAQDPIISTLYPYTSVEQKNEDGYRYNLLPYRPSYIGHTPTGTFPDLEDVLTRVEVLEVYEKYYKYTTKTNESGDFMIVGVPLGNQQIFMDLDLSDMGCFSLRPQDLIRTGRGVIDQFAGSQFRSSTDLNSLPQIVSLSADIDVGSFWGQEDLCNIGITRNDFDLETVGIKIEPTAVFMGSIFSTNDNDSIRKNCKPTSEGGNLCDLVTGEGTIQAIRQTILIDENGDPVLEEYKLTNGGKVIDSDGTFLVDVPMNLDYVVTNEFGEQVLSNDPSIGIPTSAKYRFKFKFQAEVENVPTIGQQFLPILGTAQRAQFLVPQIREYGWTGTSLNPGIDPDSLSNEDSVNYNPNYTANTQWQQYNNSYSFSLDWNDYPDKSAAINCEDFFYKMKYNKVYTPSVLIDEFRKGSGRGRFVGIKEITERSCQTTNNPFPVTEGVRNFDLIFFLFNILLTVFTPIILALILIGHIICFIWPVLRFILNVVINAVIGIIFILCLAIRAITFGLLKLNCSRIKTVNIPKQCPLTSIPLPNLSYPDCDACDCESRPAGQSEEIPAGVDNTTVLFNANQYEFYDRLIALDGDDEIKETWMAKYQYGFQSSMSGFDDGENNSDFTKAPFMDDDRDNGGNPFTKYKTWSLDIPLPERMNLFNIKSKYHTTGGWNQIQVSVNPNVNTGLFHKDNVLAIVCDPNTLNLFEPGQILTFQNVETSVDPNISGFTTGYTKTGSYAATVVNANASNPGVAATRNYIITGTTDGLVQDSSGQYIAQYKFPADVEYYQVITAHTVSAYTALTQSVGGGVPQAPNEAGYSAGSNLTFMQRYIFGYQRVQRFGTAINDPWEYPDDNTTGAGDTGMFEQNGPNFRLNSDYLNHIVVFLVRGVDMYTDRQDIEYDLSKLYGVSSGGPKVRGYYKMNVPIQPYASSTDWRLPRHNLIANNASSSNGYLFFGSYSFTPGTNFQSFNTKNHLDYSCLDSSNVKLGTSNNTNYSLDFGTTNQSLSLDKSTTSWDTMINYGSPVDSYRSGYQNLEIVEGGTVIMCNDTSSGNNPDRNNYRYFSPTYFTQYPTDTLTVSNSVRIVMRAERLPSSDVRDRRFVLHQNGAFAMYQLSDGGESSLLVPTYRTGTETNGDLSDDFAEDGGTVAQTVLATFNCETMVPLRCYSGDGATFDVRPTTDECYYVGDPQAGVTKMYKGCYYLLQRNFFIAADFNIFNEWRQRFRIMFALCRGVVSLSFTNNWINGGLYMYSFFKDDIYNQPLSATTYNSLPTYKYCRDCVAFGETNNQFFYRASPYNSVTSQFTGKQSPFKKKQSPSDPDVPYPAQNLRLLGNPTTIMDLGPKDQFIQEVCLSGDFEGYVASQVPSTSYQETADLLQLFAISRLSNSSLLELWTSTGDSSIKSLFSRTKDRLDADIVQLLSINSEFGVKPYTGDNYGDDNLSFTNNPVGPTMGLFFSANTISRDLITPGRITFQDSTISFLTNYYGFEDQIVPYQAWKIDPAGGTIFGTQLNDWNAKTSTEITLIKYQSVDRLLGGNTPSLQPTFPSEVTTPTTQIPGFIYNSQSTGGITPTITPKTTLTGPLPSSMMTGAPFFFYFGLRRGKTAMNRFITNYVIGS